jgi:hypothetical protein
MQGDAVAVTLGIVAAILFIGADGALRACVTITGFIARGL